MSYLALRAPARRSRALKSAAGRVLDFPLSNRLLWTGAVVLAFVTWPIKTLVPAAGGYDPSGIAATQLAHKAGLQFGTDLVFNYGPLGFLNYGMVFDSRTAALSLLYTALISAAFAGGLLLLLRTRFSALPSIAITWAALSLAHHAVSPIELAAFTAFVWTMAAIQGILSQRVQAALVPAAGVLAGAGLLMKIDIGIVVLAIGAIAAWVLPPGRWRGELRLLGSFFAVALGLWFATGGTVSGIPRYVRTAGDVVLGYPDGQGVDISHKWDWPAAVLLLGLFAYLIFRSRKPAHRYAYFLVPLVFLYLQFKHGFVRHDSFHTSGFFLAASIAPFALVGRRLTSRIVATWAIGSVVVLASIVGSGRLVKSLDGVKVFPNPVSAVKDAGDDALTLASSSRLAKAVDEGKANIRNDLRLTGPEVAAMRGQSVHVDPLDVSATWAYGLRWRPVPAFQLDNAYTNHLDDLDAKALLAANGPTRVLRLRASVVADHHYRAWQSPQYMTTLLCNYRAIVNDPNVQVLGRSGNRCGAPRLIGTASVAPGRSVTVPAAGRDDLVVARFDVSTTLANRVSSVVFRPLTFPAAVLDGVSYRLLANTASHPHVLRVPASEGFYPDYTKAGPNVHTLRLANIAGGGTVRFYAMRVARR